MRIFSGLAGWFRSFDWRGFARPRTPRPFAGLALAACAGILLGEGGARFFGASETGGWQEGPWWACAVFFTLAAAFAWFRGPVLCGALVISGFATIHLFRLTDPASMGLASALEDLPTAPEARSEETDPEPASAGRMIRARGIILDEPRGSTPAGSSVGAGGGVNWRFTFGLSFAEVRARGWNCRARVKVFWRNGPPMLSSGERLEMTGTGGSIRSPRNPGEFDFAGFLRRRDIRTEIQCGGLTDVRRLPAAGAWWSPSLPAAQRGFQRWTHRRLTLDLEDDPEVAAVYSTLLLGLRSEPGLGELQPAFQRTGTLHFFAIDGLKLGLISWLLARALGVSGIRRPWKGVLILPLLVGYALATGLGPASLRAVLVAAVFLGGEWIDRPPRPLNSLGIAAVLILATDTNQLFDLGFQLTFLVVLSILLPGARLGSWCVGIGAPDPFLPRKLFSTRLLVFEEFRRHLIGLICVSCAASLGSLPLMWFYFNVVSPVSTLANVAVFPLAFGMIAVGVTSLAASVFSSAWSVWLNNGSWLLAKGMLGVVRLCDAVPGGSFYAALPDGRWERPVVELTVLDLERGARTVCMRAPDGTWLLNTGKPFDYQRVVLPFLHSRGSDRLAGMILTQADSGHLAAAPLVLDELAPARVFDTATVGRSVYQKAFLNAMGLRKLAFTHWARGDHLDLGRGVELRVLYPPEHPPGRAAGDKALVLQLRADGWRVLLLGDGGVLTQQWLVEHESPGTLRSDVLVTGSSLDGSGPGAEFRRVVAPRLIVRENAQGTPRDGVSTPADSSDYLMTAAQSGAITLRLYPRRIEAAGYVDGKALMIAR